MNIKNVSWYSESMGGIEGSAEKIMRAKNLAFLLIKMN